MRMDPGAAQYRHLPRTSLVAALRPVAVTRPKWENWARTFLAVPRALFVPATVHQARVALELASRDHRVLRPVGIGHSPSDVACSRDYMLDVTRLNRVLEVNPQPESGPPYVIAEAGITLSDLHAALRKHGLAMRNLGSISDQTLAGIVATATHGSGIHFGVMSTHVLALTLLTPSNEILSCSKTENQDVFEATVCGVGATGLILTIKLEVEKAFRLKDVHTVRPFGEVVRDLDILKCAGEHVRLWWFPSVGTVRCMVSSRTEEPPTPPAPLAWFWGSALGFHAVQLLLLFTRYCRPLPKPSPKFSPLTWLWAWLVHILSWTWAYPLYKAGAHTWAARLACWLAGSEGGVIVDESVSVFNVECRYPQHTTEWALPSARAAACLTELGAWLDEEARSATGERPHFPIEIRFSAADALWLSPSSGGETCWIGIVQFKPYNLPTRYRALFAQFERILARHGGRPHWAKAHHLDAQAVRRLYPDFGKFLRVVREVDPTGIFRNEYIERHLMGGASDGREFKARRLSSDSSSPDSDFDVASEGEGADWRTDWRLPPPEEELRRAEERRRGAVSWLDSEDEEGSSSPSEDGEGSSSDSEATLAASVELPESTRGEGEGLRLRSAAQKEKDEEDELEDEDAETQKQKQKHPARTLLPASEKLN